MSAISSAVPDFVKKPIRALQAIPYYGTGRFCPICEQSASKFRQVGREHREDAQCPYCLSAERHRLLLLYLERKTNLFNSAMKQVLHVSPARCMETKLQGLLGDRYLTSDLFDLRAMVKMDITNIQYPNQSFDVILCSHVLEHVDDDIQAMKEFYRVLKDDGWAILLVPITSDRTFGDPSITDPAKRLALFGEVDHVRRYGPDYIDRLCSVGFKVDMAEAEDIASLEEIAQMRLTADSGEIYLCVK